MDHLFNHSFESHLSSIVGGIDSGDTIFMQLINFIRQYRSTAAAKYLDMATSIFIQQVLHDYFKDFESEVPMYLHTEKSLEAVSKITSNVGVKDNLYNAYEALLKINVVEEREMTVLQEWLKLF